MVGQNVAIKIAKTGILGQLFSPKTLRIDIKQGYYWIVKIIYQHLSLEIFFQFSKNIKLLKAQKMKSASKDEF